MKNIVIKNISLFLILSLILTMAVGCSKKANPASDFDYTISKNDQVVINQYLGESVDVVIPKEIEGCPVTVIYSVAFMNTDIKSITIPDTVVTIWANAFANCQELRTVKMGNGVKTVMYEAFRDCSKLKNLTLSKNLETIEACAFQGCTSLQELFIPKTISKWGMQAFYGCPLTSLTFEDGIESIGSYACFATGRTLKSITIPASVTTLGEYCFDSGLAEVYFKGDAPTKIGDDPFDESTVIYYNKKASGWENTPLNEYTLKEK